jgi:nitric oxide dioxygenase
MSTLTTDQIARVKATVPVLAAHGTTITRHFYKRMFAHHPELKNVFNQTHQISGSQPETLARAVYAYAANIDNLGVLGSAVSRITHKHASLNIRPEHYPIVGRHLLGAIVDVLGDAVDKPTMDAWEAAYGQLADIMIGAEARLYSGAAWTGFRPFVVARKEIESDEIASFYLAPADGSPACSFEPGQYLSVKRFVDELGVDQPRQYSLSDAPNGHWLRISVKREAGRWRRGWHDCACQRADGRLHARARPDDACCAGERRRGRDADDLHAVDAACRAESAPGDLCPCVP